MNKQTKIQTSQSFQAFLSSINLLFVLSFHQPTFLLIRCRRRRCCRSRSTTNSNFHHRVQGGGWWLLTATCPFHGVQRRS
ncbi:hypothetical protein Hanom_Chr07g00648451 [Helianthus anomalus]